MNYRYLVTQPDLNAHGTLHGGILMKWVDEACGMQARLETEHVCATVHIDSIDFCDTARLGDVIQIDVGEGSVGNTSITFSATASVVIPGREKNLHKVASFDNVVFVAIDDENNPVPITSWHKQHV